MPEIKKYLNRNGLEEYNSLLPHSSGKMQDYVDDWLDAHPEATTTVQDGAISEPKLADKSVSLRALADDTVHMLKGMMLTREISGEVLTADDAYSAPPVSLDIAGKSTQDGTPTPENPVPIDSIEVLELPVTFVGKNLASPATTPLSKTSNGITYSWDGERLNASGTSSASNSTSMNIPIGNVLTLYAGKTYTFSLQGTFNTGGSGTTFYFNTSKPGKTNWTLRYVFGRAGANSWAYTPTEDMVLRNFSLRISSSGTTVNISAHLQLELGSTATAYEPYAVITANIPLQGHVLRSLPNGTHDTLSLTYLRPSAREGWAWYSRELVQRVLHVTASELAANTHWIKSGVALNGYYVPISYFDGAVGNKAALCNMFSYASSLNEYFNNYGRMWIDNNFNFNVDPTLAGSTIANFKTWLATTDLELISLLATPVITALDPIELPILPAPSFTIWSNPSTGLQIEYIRDSNLVIQRIEEAIADQ